MNKTGITGKIFLQESTKGVPAEIFLESSFIVFLMQSGERVSAALKNIDFEAGGYENRDLILKGKNTEGHGFLCYISLGDKEQFLHFCSSVIREEDRIKLDNYLYSSNKRKYIGLLSWFVFGFIVVLLVISIFIGFSFFGDYIVCKIPAKYDSIIGKLTAENIIAKNKKITNGVLFNEINRILQKVSGGLGDTPYTFTLYLVENDEVNAMAAPGGHIIVFTGLVKKVNNAEELAGVLAHECSHVYYRHSIKQLAKQFLWFTFSYYFSSEASMASYATALTKFLMQQAYSREDEREADVKAVDILVKTGIEPVSFSNFFKRLSITNSIDKKFQIISTHPSHNERLAYLQSIYSSIEKREYEPLSPDWANIVNK